jgi:hypothetical protein
MELCRNIFRVKKHPWFSYSFFTEFCRFDVAYVTESKNYIIIC